MFGARKAFMNSQPITLAPAARHPGPNLGIVAMIFTVLFLAGLYPVTMFGGKPYFPGPGESASAIVSFFQMRPSAVLLCAFFHFGAAIALGIFTPSAVSQLRFLGVRAAGPYIALFGGLATAINMESQRQFFGLWLVLASRKIPLSCRRYTTFNTSLAGQVSRYHSVF
jgi:hypothetical protein